jgi:hypothetical protein
MTAWRPPSLSTRTGAEIKRRRCFRTLKRVDVVAGDALYEVISHNASLDCHARGRAHLGLRLGPLRPCLLFYSLFDRVGRVVVVSTARPGSQSLNTALKPCRTFDEIEKWTPSGCAPRFPLLQEEINQIVANDRKAVAGGIRNSTRTRGGAPDRSGNSRRRRA